MTNALSALTDNAPPSDRRLPGPACAMATAYRNLANDDERDTLAEWVRQPNRYTNRWISDRLRELATQRDDATVFVPEHTVTRHRQNRCACWQREPALVVPAEAA